MLRAIVTRYPALGFVLYRRYWLASLAAVGATQIAILGQGWLVFALSGSALDLGILGAMASVPAIVMTFFGGAIADRFDKRSVLLVTSALTAAAYFVLGALDAADLVQVWHVWSISAAVAVLSGVDWPTRQAFFVHLIERPALLSAVALNSMLWQSTRMVIPAVGGVMLAWMDTSSVFLLAGLGYVVMYAVVARIPVRIAGIRDRSPLAQIAEGVRFIVGHDLFRSLLLLSFASMFFANSYVQLMPAFADLLGAREAGYGMLLSAGGVGAVAGTVLAGGLNAERNYGTLLLLTGALSAILLYGFAAANLVPSYAIALIATGIASLFGAMFLIYTTTAMQMEVPDALRGRVMGLHGITYSLPPLGALLLGAAADHVGAPVAVMGSLTLFLLVLVAVTVYSREIRGLAAPTADG